MMMRLSSSLPKLGWLMVIIAFPSLAVVPDPGSCLARGSDPLSKPDPAWAQGRLSRRRRALAAAMRAQAAIRSVRGAKDLLILDETMT
jgi:hypothetical protein